MKPRIGASATVATCSQKGTLGGAGVGAAVTADRSEPVTNRGATT
jgi:hypothetical protein